MLGLPKEEWHALAKKTLEACEGNVTLAAELLGVPYKQLSRALNHRDLAPWWIKFKDKTVLARVRARVRAAKVRQRERDLVRSGATPEQAYELATRGRAQGGWGRPRSPTYEE